MTKQETEQLLRLENKIDNLSNQVSGLYARLEKLDRHIDFINKTYDGLKGPIGIASRFFKR